MEATARCHRAAQIHAANNDRHWTLDGRIALITGGASGIGAASVHRSNPGGRRPRRHPRPRPASRACHRGGARRRARHRRRRHALERSSRTPPSRVSRVCWAASTCSSARPASRRLAAHHRSRRRRVGAPPGRQRKRCLLRQPRGAFPAWSRAATAASSTWRRWQARRATLTSGRLTGRHCRADRHDEGDRLDVATTGVLVNCITPLAGGDPHGGDISQEHIDYNCAGAVGERRMRQMRSRS